MTVFSPLRRALQRAQVRAVIVGLVVDAERRTSGEANWASSSPNKKPRFRNAGAPPGHTSDYTMETTITSEVEGRIAEVLVKAGSRVEAGDLLLRLE